MFQATRNIGDYLTFGKTYGEFQLKYALLHLVVVSNLLAYAGLDTFGQSQSGISITTADHLEAPGWWPTKGDADRKLFLGNDRCKQCHVSVAATQETTPMFHSGTPASQSRILKAHESLDFREGDFKTVIAWTPEGDSYSRSNGSQSAMLTADWAFGSPQKGQTYLLKEESAYYESRLSYFVKLQSLDVTVGHSPSVPEDIKAAVGRKLQAKEIRLCFGCHTTASMTSGILSPEDAVPGVTCEACHGPGAKHVALMKSREGEGRLKAILNPALLTPSDSVDFCGACHKTWADVLEMPKFQGLLEIRFQPYRLEQSRCWGAKGYSRLTCVACHDHHKPLVHDPEAYDSKCLACHSRRPSSTAT